LLDAEKKDIEAYCRDNGYKFVVDKTNNQSIYTRNKIRLELIPDICKSFNPAFIDTIVHNAENIRDDADFLRIESEERYAELNENGKIKIDKLKTLHRAMIKRVILIMHERYFGDNKNMQSVHVEEIMKLIESGKSGKSVNIDNNTKCVSEAGWIYLKPGDEKSVEYEYRLRLNEEIYNKEYGLSITLKEWQGSGEKFYFENCHNITVRNRRQGDIFYPVGMTGKKKLSDYFTDEKIPLSERYKIPLIVCDNEIAYIVGKRKDRRFVQGNKAYAILIGK